MLLHSTNAIGTEILPSGAILFTPMELTVIALAREVEHSGRVAVSRKPSSRPTNASREVMQTGGLPMLGSKRFASSSTAFIDGAEA